MCLTAFDGVSEMEASCARILTGQWAMAQPLKADAVHGSALTFPVIACNTLLFFFQSLKLGTLLTIAVREDRTGSALQRIWQASRKHHDDAQCSLGWLKPSLHLNSFPCQ